MAAYPTEVVNGWVDEGNGHMMLAAVTATRRLRHRTGSAPHWWCGTIASCRRSHVRRPNVT